MTVDQDGLVIVNMFKSVYHHHQLNLSCFVYNFKNLEIRTNFSSRQKVKNKVIMWSCSHSDSMSNSESVIHELFITHANSSIKVSNGFNESNVFRKFSNSFNVE